MGDYIRTIDGTRLHVSSFLHLLYPSTYESHVNNVIYLHTFPSLVSFNINAGTGRQRSQFSFVRLAKNLCVSACINFYPTKPKRMLSIIGKGAGTSRLLCRNAIAAVIGLVVSFRVECKVLIKSNDVCVLICSARDIATNTDHMFTKAVNRLADSIERIGDHQARFHLYGLFKQVTTSLQNSNCLYYNG